MDPPAKFLLCCASPCSVCRVCGRAVYEKCFLQVPCQIHGKQQSQCPGFAGPLRTGLHLPLSHWGSAAAVPFQPSCLSEHSSSAPEKYLEMGALLTCWAHQVGSVFQQEMLIFAKSLVPGRACGYPRPALLNSSVQFLFVSCLLNQNKPIYAVSSREQDLLPILVICTNCSPEILISTGNSPVQPGTQGNTKLSSLQLSHLKIFWLDMCFACLENFSPQHQLSPSFCASFHPVPCKDTLGEFNRSCVQLLNL